jgi:hypothetical protein
MYHTSFSRLSRVEIENMLKLAKKFDAKGKYSGMRILPHSIKEVEEALERARTGNLLKKAETAETTETDRTSKLGIRKPEENEDEYSPYGKWVKALQHSQGLDTSIKDKYFGSNKDNSASAEDSEIQKNQKNIAERKQNKHRRQLEEAQRINNEKLREFMKKQRKAKEVFAQNSEASSIKEQINNAIKNSKI